MARKLYLRSILAVLFASFLMWTPTNFAKAEQVSLDVLMVLMWSEHYNMPHNQEPEAWLKSLVKTLNKELKSYPDNPNTIMLYLGDAYHWLGHVLEDKARPEEAYVAHLKSMDFYNQSESLYSPAINFFWPEGHARFHLTRLAEKLGYPVRASWRLGWRQRHETDHQYELRREYMTGLREVLTRNCEGLFQASENLDPAA